MAPLLVVICDDAPYRALLEHLLASAGYSVRALGDGPGAHAQIKPLAPDLVLLDLQVALAGAELIVLDMLRLDPATAQVPVLLSTVDAPFIAALRPHLARQGCRLLLKPCTLPELLGAVAAIVGP